MFNVKLATYKLSCLVCPPPVATVLQRLRVDLTAAHVFHGQRQSFTIFHVLVAQSLDIGLLDLSMFGPDDLTTVVHGDCWFITTNLNIHIEHCTLQAVGLNSFHWNIILIYLGNRPCCIFHTETSAFLPCGNRPQGTSWYHLLLSSSPVHRSN